MKKVIVTLGREFGCNAREIGRQLAAKLGVGFYDHELVDRAALRAGISGGMVLNNDDFDYGMDKCFYTEKAIEAQGFVIRDIANHESCVLLGRCSDFFLAEFPSVLHAFVYAPLPYRIHHVSEAYKLDGRAAEKLIAKIDEKRHSYYRYVTGRNRGDRHGRNLMIDVEKFGIEGTVELICQACRRLGLGTE
jgi:cytidylate kinase